jgi:protein-S-isoprenylcysteine O-methyltransferase Ste14
MSANQSRAGGLPASDVSSAVGAIGVAGLFAWILLCRSWPALADHFPLPGPHVRLAGPYAALAAMVFAGALMAAWSVLVDKVYRHPANGIDWRRKGPLSATLHVSGTKLAGLWATWALIGFIYCLGRWYWSGQYLFAMEVIAWAALPLFVISVPYVLGLDRVLVEPRDPAWNFGAMLIGREAWDGDEVKRHWRAWIIKGFFGAFMISILPGGFAAVVGADWSAVVRDPVRTGNALFDILFTIDVQIGTVGYLLTLRPLGAQIRSGNPYVAGWLAALICYPPFVYAFMGSGGVLQYEVNTAGWNYWFSGHEALLWAWAAMLATLTAIYAWATAAFGIRFSNLTYRGVLTNGPYRYCRHPAYLAKNLFWWLSTLPFLVTSRSPVDMIRDTVFLGCVSAIYFWRAKTEEAHLLGEDAKYREYHAWMERNGLVTAPLARLLRRVRPRPVAVQPAE